ncbi:MFS transporter [Actinoplanes teichomyceticus]|uniref:SET family sugar efflux transporter-like MFS transporter n=1 Tax=Actinoplanes teichomyceticus TaxID=1867 RepID=A0A561VLX0_ACTTI|nr:MFS transporter [Actinoplanes teichomyceticus]TWG12619.1 SET family sugar efflux transporter-like MFS transporter [Actinoplanes teichomyceticus]GIF13989.1 putative sugar efflux transporter [Actinoplanes teichomyceticus]
MPFLALFAAILLLGIADSMVNSYIVLFGADVAGLTPLQIGVWSSVFAIGGITIGWWLGRLFDRRPARTYAIVVILLGSAGYLLLPRVSSFPVLLVMAATALGAMGAAFPQLFALARAVLGDGALGRRSAPLLRSAWSLAWAVGPLLGALVLSRGGYPGLLWTAAGVFLVCALTVLVVPRPGAAPAAASAPGEVPVLLTVSVTLFFTAMFAGGVALPLFVTRALHQQAASVGVLYSVCAAVEVVATLGLAAVPARVSQRAVILGGFAALAGYFALTVVSSGMLMLVLGQVLRGVGIAIVGAAGIRYFQDLLAPAAGRATTLFANASTAGLLVSGILSGVAVEHAGYRTTLLLCAVTAALGAVAFGLGSRCQDGSRDLEEAPGVR